LSSALPFLTRWIITARHFFVRIFARGGRAAHGLAFGVVMQPEAPDILQGETLGLRQEFPTEQNARAADAGEE
jgi:hypothetical protein